MKKIVCMILAAVMICSFGATGFAQDGIPESGGLPPVQDSSVNDAEAPPSAEPSAPPQETDASPGESGPENAGPSPSAVVSPQPAQVQSANAAPVPSAAPALGETSGAGGTAVSRGIIGRIREPLSERAKELLETQIVLALEDMSEDGSEFAGGLLFFFYNATDYTLVEIYETVLETLEVVNEIDDEVDALTIRMEELFDEIERGFAQNAYNDCAEDLDAVYGRLAPLWEDYTALLAEADAKAEDGEISEPEELAIQGKTKELMQDIYAVYGPFGVSSFESDLELVHNAMYSPSGRTTFTDAQIELSRLNLPFEHQIVDEAAAAFNYGAALQTALLWLYGEYSNYMLSNDTVLNDPQVTLHPFAAVGDQTIENLNAQAEKSGINELMTPEEVETSITLADGTVLPAYHVIVNADGHEYMIGRETLRLGSAVTSYSRENDIYRQPSHEGKLTSADGRWYIPATESEMKTLFTSTITNPGSWLSDQGKLSLPSHDALLLADISQKTESRLNGIQKQYIYSFDQGMLDSHHLTGDRDKVTANSYHDIVDEDTSVKWAGRSEEILFQDTELLYVFFDKSNQTAGIPTDDNGFLAPSDPTTLPDEIYLGEGSGLNLTKLNSTDMLNKVVVVSGNAAILGGGRTYQNLQIQMRPGADLTVDGLNIDHKNMNKAAVDVYASDAKLTVRGECSFRGGAGMYLDKDSVLDVKGEGEGAAITIAGTWGFNVHEDSYGNFLGPTTARFDGLAVSVQGTEYGLRGLYWMECRNCDVYISGDKCDLYTRTTGGVNCYFYDCNVTIAHNTKKDHHVNVKISESTAINTPVSYKIKTATSYVKNAESKSDIYLYLTGTDRSGNTVTTNGVNITDLAGGKFTNNSYDNFYTDFDVYLTDIDYITLVNKGSDAWYPDWIEITNDYELPNPETGEECYYHFKVDSFIDTKNYEYRFTHDGKRNAPATVGSTQPISDEELIAMLEKAGAPSTLQTTVDDGHTVSAQVLAALKRLGQRLQYAVTDADGNTLYQWKFDGTKITDASLLTRLGITIAKTQEDDYGGLLAGKDGLVLRFAHDGLLPGGTQVRVNAARHGYAEGDIFTLYHIGDGALKTAAEGLAVGEDGFVTLEISHCSDYALVKTGTGGSANPKTGDGRDIAPWLALTAAAAGAAAFCAARLRKRRRGDIS